MIRARRAGRKTQTRRRISNLTWIADTAPGIAPYWRYSDDNGSGPFEGYIKEWVLKECPYGKPGDRLVVKEAAWMWCAKVVSGLTKKTKKPKVCWVESRNVAPIYCADHPEKPSHIPEGQRQMVGAVGYEWRKKIARFLPRWASRDELEIIDIRVERLNDISEEDAVEEGICDRDDGESYCPVKSKGWVRIGPWQDVCPHCGGWDHFDYGSEISHYAQLWESINGPGSWEMNPWVWVVEFKVIAGGRDS